MDTYNAVHESRCGPGDARPTALQVVSDEQETRRRDSVALQNLVIVITGATSGIGFETAKALYTTGARLFITVRDMDKGQITVNQILKALPSKGNRKTPIETLKVDMTSLSSVRSGAYELLSKTDRIDVLINNAGIAAVPYGQTEDGFESHWGVNYIAPFLFTHLLLPCLQASSTPVHCSRVINVTSTGHRLFPTHLDDPNFEITPYESMSAYATSKLANIYHANFIDREFSGCGIRALSLHPGTVPDTSLLRALNNSAVVHPQSGAAPAGYKEEVKLVEQGAATTVFAAIASCLEGKGGLYLENCTIGKAAIPGFGPMDGGYDATAFDATAEETLWNETCAVLEVNHSF